MGPAGSHDDMRRYDDSDTADPVHRLRCSFPSLSPKSTLCRDVSLVGKKFDSVESQPDSMLPPF